jgi:hypothetical protein
VRANISSHPCKGRLQHPPCPSPAAEHSGCCRKGPCLRNWSSAAGSKPELRGGSQHTPLSHHQLQRHASAPVRLGQLGDDFPDLAVRHARLADGDGVVKALRGEGSSAARSSIAQPCQQDRTLRMAASMGMEARRLSAGQQAQRSAAPAVPHVVSDPKQLLGLLVHFPHHKRLVEVACSARSTTQAIQVAKRSRRAAARAKGVAPLQRRPHVALAARSAAGTACTAASAVCTGSCTAVSRPPWYPL